MIEASIYLGLVLPGAGATGAWSAILIAGTHEKCLSGTVANTTEPALAITGLTAALDLFKEPARLSICTRSSEVITLVERLAESAVETRNEAKCRLSTLLRAHEVLAEVGDEELLGRAQAIAHQELATMQTQAQPKRCPAYEYQLVDEHLPTASPSWLVMISQDPIDEAARELRLRFGPKRVRAIRPMGRPDEAISLKPS